MAFCKGSAALKAGCVLAAVAQGTRRQTGKILKDLLNNNAVFELGGFFQMPPISSPPALSLELPTLPCRWLDISSSSLHLVFLHHTTILTAYTTQLLPNNR
ncbi:hypothetical protein VTL71DRAFT_10953 [Oculimacula yallundae]|uniref:Uncharacterized protein n=1 Tax=Oculimacula yallundae TaxID=86028 RepID=A0ABR4CUX9_9HELO